MAAERRCSKVIAGKDHFYGEQGVGLLSIDLNVRCSTLEYQVEMEILGSDQS